MFQSGDENDKPFNFSTLIIQSGELKPGRPDPISTDKRRIISKTSQISISKGVSWAKMKPRDNKMYNLSEICNLKNETKFWHIPEFYFHSNF